MDSILAIGILIGVCTAVVLVRLAQVERRLARLSRLDAKVDALLKTAGISFDALHDVPPGVRDAIEQGETILAIRRFREATGAGLKEAKEYIDEVRRRTATS